MVTCWKDKCRMNSIQLACMAEPLSMSLLSDSFTMSAVQCVLMEIFDDLPSPCFIDIVMFFLYLCEMVCLLVCTYLKYAVPHPPRLIVSYVISI